MTPTPKARENIRMQSLIYFSVYLIGGGTLWGLLQPGIWTWMGTVLVFVVHPFLDFVFDKKQIQEVASPDKALAGKSLFLSLPFCLALMAVFFWQFQIEFNAPSVDWPRTLGLVFSTGIVMGVIGINTAHEFIHRDQSWQRAFGVAQLMLVNFGSFRINHVFIHHKWVATPLDPTTARWNELIYFYWGRSFVGGLAASWKFEKDRLNRSETSQVKRLLRNRMLHYALGFVLGSLALTLIGGPAMPLAWWSVSVVSILLLQTVDYVEHYGLMRQELSPAVFEGVKPKHSWDSYTLMTNSVLFNLGIHSHHHTRASLHFTELKPAAGIAGHARRLPFGYAVMVLIALVPPIFRQLMHPLLIERK